MKRFLFLSLQWFIQHQRTWLRLLTWITRFGYWLFILYGLVEWFRPGKRAEKLYQRRTLLYCLFAVGLGSSLSFFIGRIWRRPRPFVRGKALALVAHKANASFPSNHAMNSLAISLLLLAQKNPWGLPALLWSGVLAASRVLSGLHYPSDILAGFGLGALSAHLVYHSKRAQLTAGKILYAWHGLTTVLATWWRGYL